VRLFHVSEEPDIQVFVPRLPKRKDLDQSVGLVWAVDEARLPNFLTPRDCPRVTYHIGENTSDSDKERFFSSSGVSHCVVVEHRWLEAMRSTSLFLYEFDTVDFELQDSVAGYYVSRKAQYPKGKCAYETMHKIKRTLRAILSHAKKQRLINDNYASADYIDFPKRPSKEIDYMNDEDAKKFYAAADTYPDIRYKTAAMILLLTGMRRSRTAPPNGAFPAAYQHYHADRSRRAVGHSGR